MEPVDFIDLINRIAAKEGQGKITNLLIVGLVGTNEWACVNSLSPHKDGGYMLSGPAFNFITNNGSVARPMVSRVFATNIMAIPEAQRVYVQAAFSEEGGRYYPHRRTLAVEVYFPQSLVVDDDDEGEEEEVEMPDPEWFDRMEEGLSEDSI